MKTKYLFFDVDGTLLPFGLDMPRSCHDALLQAKANGHKIFLSTGRSPAELDPRLKVIPFDGGIFAGGARADIGDKTIWESFISHEELDWIYNKGREMGWLLLVQTARGSFLTKEMETALYDLFMESLGRTLVIGGLNIVDKLPYPDDATKLVFITPNHDAQKAKEILSSHFDVVDNTMGVPLDACAEIIQKGISKASGLERIIEYYGASIEDSIAFGDGANDIEIVEAAGCGVAMGNASEELKSVADYTTSDVDKDGIALALKHLGVI